jgi:MoaA/NifB/PqqE/SkfB family radical SAM enzyme
MHSIPSGDVLGCCVWKTDHSLGSVKTQTISEIANDEPMKNVRRRMLAGERLTECDSCNLREDSDPGYATHRKLYNRQHRNLIGPLLSKTNNDGSINYEFKLRSMNLRFSNLCNYSCRSCYSGYSSVWAQEQKIKKPVINIIEDNPDYLNQILEHLPWVEYINFTGGESMLTDEHWVILQRLIDLNKRDVVIDFYTNVSRLEYRGRKLIDTIKQLNIDKFRVRVSLDAMGSRAEIYRNGTVWSTVENNLKTLYDSGIQIIVNCTIGATNVLHAPDLQRYLIESRLIKTEYSNSIVPAWICTNLVYSPYLRTTILPLEYKIKVRDKILQHIEYLKSKSIDHKPWLDVISYMLSRDDSDMIPEFIDYNKKLDCVRNQNTLQAFPELSSIGDWS